MNNDFRFTDVVPQNANPYHSPNSSPAETMGPKHSGIGIASFVLSLLVGFSIFALIVVAGVIETSTPSGMDENSSTAMIIGLGIMALGLMSLVSIGLGIGGLFEQNRKKIFAILGLTFSLLTVLGTAALILFGLSMG